MAVIDVQVPDIGTDGDVEVIEVSVAPGDEVAVEQTIIVLESDKATVEVPCPHAGTVRSVAVKVGDTVRKGSPVLVLDAAGDDASASSPAAASVSLAGVTGKDVAETAVAPTSVEPPPSTVPASPLTPSAARAESSPSTSALQVAPASNAHAHAGPAVRKLARELGVNLGDVKGSGPKARIIKDDVHAHVKQLLSRRAAAPTGGDGTLPELPVIDFAKWGPVEQQPLRKLRRVSARNLHRAWLHIPHVTQHDEADVTELEDFRVFENGRLKGQGVKLTMLAFLVKACVGALKQYPDFNSSLTADGESLVVKNYWHIGIAVDTPEGLVVPVIRDADRKGIIEIAGEMGELSKKARDRKLSPADMQGATFSISSLGGIGGTAFTPIVNWPEVAILGVSRARIQPHWNGKTFEPRLMLPLSLSYDHRVIDGAAAARFITYLSALLGDLRRLSL